MEIFKTKFKDLLIYKDKTFRDNRGYFKELFKQFYSKEKFIFDVMSFSKKGVLRGLHLQLENPQSKLVTVLSGKVFDVCLDCRKGSKTFGQFFTTILSDKNNKSIFIPKGFAHGICSLTNNVILHYKCSEYRNKKTEIGLIWNDEDLKIKWPVANPIISKKDKQNFSFTEFKQLVLKCRWQR
jgi:dTDP-4-dehydrorhamnose 3,5-epimerase